MSWYRHPSIIGAFITGLFSILAAGLLFFQQGHFGDAKFSQPSEPAAESMLLDRATKPQQPVSNERVVQPAAQPPSGAAPPHETWTQEEGELKSLLIGRWSYHGIYPDGTPFEGEISLEPTGRFYEWVGAGVRTRKRLVTLSGVWSGHNGKIDYEVRSSTDPEWIPDGHKTSATVLDISRRTVVLVDSSSGKETVLLRVD